MFIKRSRKRVGDKVYEYAYLVRTYNTSKGPRHKLEYSLGKIDHIPQEQDREIAAKLEGILAGQISLVGATPVVRKLYESLKPLKGGQKPSIIDDAEHLTLLNNGSISSSDLVLEPVAEVEIVTAEVVHDELIVVNTEIETVPPAALARSDGLEFEKAREAGSVWIGHNIWEKLELSSILRNQKFSEDEIRLTKILAFNRLIEPASEYATPDWVERTALSDILDSDLSRLNYRKLYGQLDRLHEVRTPIERELFAREVSLFNLDTSIYLYDLTSTYFEGQCASNGSAKFGYSRDKRSDCRQIVIGLMLNKDGFPVGHEIFDGNTSDCTTVEQMVATVTERVGVMQGLTLIVDRGMSDQKNLQMIRTMGHHYIVAAKHTERVKWLAEFESLDGWHEVLRSPQPEDPRTLPTGVKVKVFERGDENFVLCISQGRINKDRAIREKQEKRFLADLAKLEKRTNTGELKKAAKIYESIGRLRERYPRVGRYYEIEFDEVAKKLRWSQDDEKKRRAEQVDGSYVLRTSRKDLGDDEIWRTYMLLTRVEAAFRDLKSPLAMRPIHHQLAHRTEAHVFVCILAYHLLVSIERLLQRSGITRSWESIRKMVSTHQVVSGIVRARDGRAVEIRRDTKTTPEQRAIYDALQIPHQIFRVPKIQPVNS